MKPKCLGRTGCFLFALLSCLASADSHPPGEQSISDCQRKLLGTAFEVASKIPLKPHVKDRCRAQQSVIEACLELGQESTAERLADRIDNWRGGLCFAEIALYRAQLHEASPQTLRLLDRAAEIAGQSEGWRRDRIRARIAETYLILNRPASAEPFLAGLGTPETGSVQRTKVLVAESESFEQRMKQIEGLLDSEHFDLIHAGLTALPEMFDQFYSDSARRDEIASHLRGHANSVPPPVRVEMAARFAETALKHSDPESALGFIHEAEEWVEQYSWPLETRIELRARLIPLRFEAGDREPAKSQGRSELDLFEERKETLVDIWRAGPLRDLGAAFQKIDQRDLARSAFSRALEEGVLNPNSRPRAEDLAATCTTMALCGFEPSADLWRRIRDIQSALGDPW